MFKANGKKILVSFMILSLTLCQVTPALAGPTSNNYIKSDAVSHSENPSCTMTVSQSVSGVAFKGDASGSITAFGAYAGLNLIDYKKGDKYEVNNIYGITAFGSGARTLGDYATAVGNYNYANKRSSVFGANAAAAGEFSTALGASSSASGKYSTAVGYYSRAVGDNSFAVGYSTYAGSDATAIGQYSYATGQGAIAIGRSANVAGGDAVAFGTNATAKHNNSVALGSNSCTSSTNEVSVGSSGLQRKITNVADGTIAAGSTDAVTGNQIYGLASKTEALGNVYINETGVVSQATVAGTTKNVAQLQDTVVGGLSVNTSDKTMTIERINKYTGQYVDSKTVDVTALINTKVEIAGALGNISTSNGIVSTKKEYEVGGIKHVDVDFAMGDDFTLKDATYGNYTEYNKTGVVVSNDTGDKQASLAYGQLSFKNGDNTAMLSTGGLAINGKTYVSSAGLNANGQKITNVADGEVLAESTDAVNGSQLYATNQNVTANKIAIAEINASAPMNSGITAAKVNKYESYVTESGLNANGGKITNVAVGEISAESTDAVNGSQIYGFGVMLNDSINETNKKFENVNNIMVKLSGNVGDIQTQLTEINNDINKINIEVNDLSSNKADKTEALKTVAISNRGVVSQTTISGSSSTVAQLVDTTVGGMSLTTDKDNHKILTVNCINNYTGDVSGSKSVDVTELINAKVEIMGALGNISTSNGIVSTKTERIDPATGLKMVDVKFAMGENFTLTDLYSKNYTNYTTAGVQVSNAENTIQSAFGYGELKFTNGSDTATFGTAGLAINGKTYVSSSGLNANEQKIINVAHGEISSRSTDAVNGSQLYETNRQVAENTLNIEANKERLDNTYTKAETRSIAAFGHTIGTTYDDETHKKITLEGDGGTTITNVKAGDISATSTDAVNGSQLYQTNMQLAATNKEVQEVGAMSAALAGLHYMEPSGEGDDKVSGAVAYGGYRGQNAAAIGLAYKPNQNMMFTASTSIGTTQQSYNAGMSFKFGAGKAINKAELQKQIAFVNEENKKLKQIVATQGEQIQQLLQIVGEMRGKPVDIKASANADAKVPVVLLPLHGEYEVEFGKDYDKAVITAKVDHACKNGVATAYCREATDDEGKTYYLARVPAANRDEAEQIGKRLKELGYEPETVRVR